MLTDHFGRHLDSIFTPPWNRCTTATGECLRTTGIQILSRDVTAGRLALDGLLECPVTVDWFAKAGGRRLSREEWASTFASAIDSAIEPVGLMLHHAVMDDDEMRAWASVLRIISRHDRVTGLLMRHATGVVLQ